MHKVVLKNNKALIPDYRFESELRAQKYPLICGLDEVGRGPLAGPVVAAAVILDPELFDQKEDVGSCFGIKDSKLLTKKQREVLYDKILESALAVSIASISAPIIDRINIRQATFLAMRDAVNTLSLTPDYLLIDGRDKLDGVKMPSKAIIKGDRKSISIAAASIIAKVTRDLMLTKLGQLYPFYGFEKHAGYGTKQHKEALVSYGPIPDIHRFSFAPIKATK